MSQQYQHIQVRPIGGRIGAEIQGVQLSADLADEVVQEINQALLKHKAIFFKGQQHLDDVAQEAFAARLGTPLNHPTVPVKDGSAHILKLIHAERVQMHGILTLALLMPILKPQFYALWWRQKWAAIRFGPIPRWLMQICLSSRKL